MGGHRIVVAIACAVVATAASFEGCFLGDFSSLEGNGQDAGGDASSDVQVDGGGSDAPIADALVSDGYVFFDAASGVRFCSTQPDATFCDDFDQVDAAPLALWQPANLGTGSSVALTAAGLSPPNALLAGVVANASSMLIPANVSHQLTGTVNVAHYTYDFLVDFYDMSGSSAYFCPVDERVGLADTEVRLILSPAGVLVAAVVTPGDGGASTYPTLSAKVGVSGAVWHHVDLVMDYTQNPAVVTFTLDGATVVHEQPIPGATFGPGNVTVEAGFLYVSAPTSGWKLRVDDVAAFTQ